jgi:ATP-binding cassette subfamily B protein
MKNADQIVVLEKGKVAEIGTHQELVALQGKYFHLVKNQLELGQ